MFFFISCDGLLDINKPLNDEKNGRWVDNEWVAINNQVMVEKRESFAARWDCRAFQANDDSKCFKIAFFCLLLSSINVHQSDMKWSNEESQKAEPFLPATRSDIYKL